MNNARYIYIAPIETKHALWRADLEAAVRSTFGLPVRYCRLTIDLNRAFDQTRQQYSSSQVLLQVVENLPDDAVKILGVTAVDLFIPVLTYVFGEAQLGGPGAVVSLHRLNSCYYGLPDNPSLLAERLVKESIHELGHTFGLIHCSRPGCCLNASTYVEDIDQKSSEPCLQCRERIRIMCSHPAATGIQVPGSTVRK